jgi:hypothetical protein
LGIIREKILDPDIDVCLIDEKMLEKLGKLSKEDKNEILGLKQILDEDLMADGREVDSGCLLRKLDSLIDGIKDDLPIGLVEGSRLLALGGRETLGHDVEVLKQAQMLIPGGKKRLTDDVKNVISKSAREV